MLCSADTVSTQDHASHKRNYVGVGEFGFYSDVNGLLLEIEVREMVEALTQEML